MSEPIRILHVLNGLSSGGAESIIMNWYRHIDREKVQFDFLIRSDVNVYADEISKYGGRVFVMPPYPKNYFANRRETARFFRENAKDYAGIHVHGNALLYVNVFKMAKKNGIALRIFHSHSTSTEFKYLPIHLFNKMRIKRLATDYFACSKAAGVWAFGSQSYRVINNGIDTARFSYDKEVRKSIRKSLGISDDVVVYGHVGRFVTVKNHTFLLDAFEKILKKEKKSLLMLVGEGELFEDIENLAKEKGIYHSVLFLGRQKNISDYMNAMDVFCLPSLWAGLSIAAIEAQASGLPCVLADTITVELKLTENVEFLPISNSDIWADTAIKMSHILRRNTQEELQKSGYDVRGSVSFLESFYCSHK